MAEKMTTEELALIDQIKSHKRQVRDSLKEILFKEREQRHKKGDVFFKGLWIPGNKIELIQNELKKKGLVIFWEIHVLIIILCLFTYLVWFLFRLFLLP